MLDEAKKLELDEAMKEGDPTRYGVWGIIEGVFAPGGRSNAISKLHDGDANDEIKLLCCCCGIGYDFHHMANQYPKAKITAFDWNERKVEYCKRLAEKKGYDIKVERQDLMNLTYSDGHFDGATIIEAISCISNPRKALNEVARVLKKGGRLVIVNEMPLHKDATLWGKVFYKFWLKLQDSTNYWFWSDLRMPVHEMLEEIPELKLLDDSHYCGGAIHQITLEKI
ncbi:MAG: class I SAM-dependent methyltransferase [Candidatus Aenigmatarchaeota archaeon]